MGRAECALPLVNRHLKITSKTSGSIVVVVVGARVSALGEEDNTVGNRRKRETTDSNYPEDSCDVHAHPRSLISLGFPWFGCSDKKKSISMFLQNVPREKFRAFSKRLINSIGIVSYIS